MHFQDHFSGEASAYHCFRPRYPSQLFSYLARLTSGHELAWDCATGNGQAAVGLAREYHLVLATDASMSQITNAIACRNVRYAVMTGGQAGLAANSVDIITVAQALHWFDLEPFYAEVRRVLKRGGLLAVWCYGLLSVSARVDTLVQDFHAHRLAAFWPPERSMVDEGYANLPFPFAEASSSQWHMRASWTLDQLLGYLRTWSAVRLFQDAKEYDPVAAMEDELRRAWGTAAQREVRWPLTVHTGRTNP